MRGRGMTTASFSRNSDGSKQIARVPSRHGRRRRSKHLAVRRQLQRVLGDGRTQNVSAQMFEPLGLPGAHRDVGVQVEALDVRVARPAGGDHRCRGITAQPEHPLPGPRPRGDPPEHGRSLHVCQHRGVERQRVAAPVVDTPLQVDGVAPQQADDPPAHRRQQARHLDVARRLAQRHEALRPVALLREDALGHERVEMWVHVQRRPAALNRRHRPGAAPNPQHPRPALLEPEQRPHEHPQHGAAEAVIVGQPIAQPEGERQDPLANRQAAEHAVDQVRGTLAHAPAAARRADAPLAREGDEDLSRTAVAPEAREATRHHATGQELAQLAFDEARQPRRRRRARAPRPERSRGARAPRRAGRSARAGGARTSAARGRALPRACHDSRPTSPPGRGDAPPSNPLPLGTPALPRVHQ